MRKHLKPFQTVVVPWKTA